MDISHCFNLDDWISTDVSTFVDYVRVVTFTRTDERSMETFLPECRR